MRLHRAGSLGDGDRPPTRSATLPARPSPGAPARPGRPSSSRPAPLAARAEAQSDRVIHVARSTDTVT